MENKNKKKDKNRGKRVLILLVLIFGIFFSYQIFLRNSQVEALSKYGSRGEEVRLIQTKLKRWGYYNGNIDRNLWKSNVGSS